jgi:NADH dehydrogenase [ubiquinone] 1 alpha subcomplex assembly factor 7
MIVTGLSLSDRLARLIEASGPVSVAYYMAQANAHYYATRDPFGAAGDFTTAPEISQMFGELVGLWLADLWTRAGSPEEAHYVELGPGRGTLAADALRAMRSAGLVPDVALVETSPVLRRAQKERVPRARWHDDLDTLPASGPLLAVANEFFDALPVRQLVATEGGWRKRLVVHEEGRFRPIAGPRMSEAAIPPHLRSAPPGSILETSPASIAVVQALAQRIAEQGGAALIVDYGHERASAGETLQAVSAHLFADPWAEPGERDLSAHVDFEALEQAARRQGVRVFGPRGQGEWLIAMGLDVRAEALAKAAPGRAEELKAARDRLAAPGEMGRLFKVMALVADGWPEPAGFA